ncbi:MAG: pilin [Patescibacteria group bacterium]
MTLWKSYLHKKSYSFALFLVGFFLPAFFVYAEKIDNPISATTIQGLIKTILEGVLKIGIPIIALAIIYSGFLFVQARGNPGEIEKAKNSLVYTLIGAAILLGAWAIAQLISETVLAL